MAPLISSLNNESIRVADAQQILVISGQDVDTDLREGVGGRRLVQTRDLQVNMVV